MLASMKRIKSIVNSSESRKLRVNKILRVIYAVISFLHTHKDNMCMYYNLRTLSKNEHAGMRNLRRNL